MFNKWDGSVFSSFKHQICMKYTFSCGILFVLLFVPHVIISQFKVERKNFSSCVSRLFYLFYLNCSFPVGLLLLSLSTLQKNFRYFPPTDTRHLYLCLISDSVANMIFFFLRRYCCVLCIRTLGIRNWVLSIRKSNFFLSLSILFVWIFTLSCVFGMSLNGSA